MSQKKKHHKKKSQTKTKGKNKPSVLAYGFSKDTAAEPPKERKDVDNIRHDWIPFGSNNLFPQELEELSKSSSTHRSILRTKTTFTLGEGIKTNNPELEDLFENINALGETMDEVSFKVLSDFWKHGNGYLEVVIGHGYQNFYHQDGSVCRVSKSGTSILMHPDWENVNRTPEKITKIPIYPNIEKDGATYRTMIRFYDYESTHNFYGMPDYLAAINHIKIANQIGKYNLTRFKNGFMPSAIIELSADMGEDEAQDFIDDAVDKLTGEGDNSKILFIAKNGDGDATNVQIISDTNDGSFLELQKITNDNIISAHRWNPALSGIQVAGSLGNNQQILTIYDIIMSTVVREVQHMFLRGIKKVLKREGGYDVSDLRFENKPPVTLLGAINPVDYISMEEGRKIFHLPELSEEELEKLKEEKQPKPTNNGTDNSGGDNR